MKKGYVFAAVAALIIAAPSIQLTTSAEAGGIFDYAKKAGMLK